MTQASRSNESRDETEVADEPAVSSAPAEAAAQSLNIHAERISARVDRPHVSMPFCEFR